MSLGRLLVTTPSRSIDYEVVSPTVNVGRSPDGNQLVLDGTLKTLATFARSSNTHRAQTPKSADGIVDSNLVKRVYVVLLIFNLQTERI